MIKIHITIQDTQHLRWLLNKSVICLYAANRRVLDPKPIERINLWNFSSEFEVIGYAFKSEDMIWASEDFPEVYRAKYGGLVRLDIRPLWIYSSGGRIYWTDLLVNCHNWKKQGF